MQSKSSRTQKAAVAPDKLRKASSPLLYAQGASSLARAVARPLTRQDFDLTAESAGHLSQSTSGDRRTFLSREPLQVLLIDDDISFAAILKRSAARNGLNVTVCHDIDALGTQMNSPFAVAIVDYDLGSVTGVELVRYLENRAWTTPFVLISQSDLPHGIGRGCAEWSFVHKHLGMPAIIAAVHAARAADLEGARLQNAHRPS